MVQFDQLLWVCIAGYFLKFSFKEWEQFLGAKFSRPELESHLPDTQAGFRSARGCRDNVCALKWFISMILNEGRQAVITFIDYSAAFDTESQLFLDETLVVGETGHAFCNCDLHGV